MKRLLFLGGSLLLSLSLFAQPKVVAHRGFYTNPKHETDENTIDALKEAQMLHPFAVEFDVHKTADGVLMINHNTKINDRLDCQTSTWSELERYRLPHGGQFPTLEQWLKQAKKTPDIIMALELKAHATPECETEIIEEIVALCKKYDMMDQMAFLSFSLHACKEFARIAPGSYVVLNSFDINEKVDADKAKELGISALSYHKNVFNAHPELIDRANEIGIDTYYWIVDDFESLDWAIAHKCTHITSNFPDKMMRYLEQKALIRAHDSVSENNLREDVEYLSSDECQGRLPFTQGAERAVKYLASEMETIGLIPGYNGSYLQDVPLVMMNLKPSAQMTVATPSGELILENNKDFTAFTSSRKENVVIEGSELIFAGYGIVAEEYNKNDYEGITDPRNKVAVVFVNDPGLDSGSDYFTGDAMTYYGRWTYKYEEGIRQGLKGVLIIHEDRGAGYGWSVVQASEDVKYILDDPDVNTEGCPLQGWLSNNAARQLLANCGYDIDELKAQARKADFKPFSLGSSLSVSIHSSFSHKSSPNVVGYIPGRLHNGENIVCVAHWDHLGMIETKDGSDGIYNGATDNATAMAWLLETARAIKSMGIQPERDIVFLLPTCEEKGMFGSEYYVSHPVAPIAKTVAVINLDVIPLWGENNDLTITGYGHSDLDERVEKIAAKYGRYIMADPEASNGMFYRSDHLPFMRRGVPAMFAKGWSDSRVYGRQWSEQKIKDYWANTYHKVCDQTDPQNDNYSGLVQEVHLFLDLICSLALSDDRPKWKSKEFNP